MRDASNPKEAFSELINIHAHSANFTLNGTSLLVEKLILDS